MPNEGKVPVLVRMEREMWEQVKREARERGVSGAGLIRMIVQEWLRKEARKRKREDER